MPSVSGLLNKTPIGYVPVLIGIIVIGIAVARFLPDAFIPDPPPLLAADEGLVVPTTIADFQRGVGREVLMPKLPDGVTLAAFGIYTQPTELFPANTTAVVLAKDGWRFAEILERPGMDVEATKHTYPYTTSRPITIATGLDASLLSLEAVVSVCLDGRDEHPGACIINRILVFQGPLGAISIASDAQGATDGEMIELARSMLNP